MRGMKWFKFLIYFVLWANAIINIIMGVTYLNGSIYGLSGGETAEVYEVFPKLEGIDKLYGVGLLCLSVYALITRFSLARYKSFAPLLLYGVYILNTLAPIAYAALAAPIAGIPFSELFEIAPIIVNAVMLLINIKYFTNRSDMFCK